MTMLLSTSLNSSAIAASTGGRGNGKNGNDGNDNNGFGNGGDPKPVTTTHSDVGLGRQNGPEPSPCPPGVLAVKGCVER
jgi:hypothetical protein